VTLSVKTPATRQLRYKAQEKAKRVSLGELWVSRLSISLVPVHCRTQQSPVHLQPDRCDARRETTSASLHLCKQTKPPTVCTCASRNLFVIKLRWSRTRFLARFSGLLVGHTLTCGHLAVGSLNGASQGCAITFQLVAGAGVDIETRGHCAGSDNGQTLREQAPPRDQGSKVGTGAGTQLRRHAAKHCRTEARQERRPQYPTD